jgi:hypothetical protein
MEDALDKYLISFSSSNRITGEMMVTTSPRATCPGSCPLKDKECYAEKGHLGGWIWSALDNGEPGQKSRMRIFTFAQLLTVIRLLGKGETWRHNQAGDLITDATGTIHRAKIQALTAANEGKQCFTFTHHDVLANTENRATVKEACDAGFTINLSADTLEEADALADLNIAPVCVVVPATQATNTTTPKGRKVTICPARRKKGVTCRTCRICTRPHKAIIAFPQL